MPTSNKLAIRPLTLTCPLEPEILVVDEVLAVGDAAFQKKCLGKMGDVAKDGRTVLFVSHNMTAVKTLCKRGIWLDQGVLSQNGSVKEVISAYMMGAFTKELVKRWVEPDAPGNNYIKLYEIAVEPLDGSQIFMGDPINLKFIFEKLSENIYQVDVTFHLVDELGNLIFVGSTAYDAVQNEVGLGKLVVICTIPPDLMHEGIYTINRLLFVKDGGSILFEYRNALSFEVINTGSKSLGWMGRSTSKEGVIRPKLVWRVTNLRA